MTAYEGDSHSAVDFHLRALVSASAGPQRAESKPLPFIGANLFRLTGDDFRIESHVQQDDQHFCLAGEPGIGIGAT